MINITIDYKGVITINPTNAGAAEYSKEYVEALEKEVEKLTAATKEKKVENKNTSYYKKRKKKLYMREYMKNYYAKKKAQKEEQRLAELGLAGF
jgi:hypothetical protein